MPQDQLLQNESLGPDQFLTSLNGGLSFVYQGDGNLAHTTLINADKPVLEETYYWRGMAKATLGDRARAVEDLTRAYTLNPNSTPAGDELQRINSPGTAP
jgi:hypothetical protein